MNDAPLAVGIDLGTSAVRCAAVDAHGHCEALTSRPLTPPVEDGARVSQEARDWWIAIDDTMRALTHCLDPRRIVAIAADGTSGSLLLTDAAGEPVTPVLLYRDARCTDEAERIAAVAPSDSPARGASSALARLLHLQALHPDARHAAHPGDWITGRLLGRPGIADEHNVLKLGYDVRECRWPAWFGALGVRADLLPQVVPPGTAVGRLAPAMAERWGLSDQVTIATGTTDGVASFLATGAGAAGDAVTALGSTLVMRVLADAPVFDARLGLYSHRLGRRWLVGGASNAGGAVLLQHFDVATIASLGRRIDAERTSGLDYYPLPAPGERFPIADPTLAPRLSPRPADDALFLHGLLEGLVHVERLGYETIVSAGGPRPKRLFAVGGGTRNPVWQRLRERALGLPLHTPRHEEAACGVARLAWAALSAGQVAAW